MSSPLGPDRRPDRQNGLVADSYAWLRSVDARECEGLLDAMERAEIACYTALPALGSDRNRDVYVDVRKTAEATSVADTAHRDFANRRISLDPQEVEDRFAELISSLGGPSDVPDLPPTDRSGSTDLGPRDPVAGDPVAGDPEPGDRPFQDRQHADRPFQDPLFQDRQHADRPFEDRPFEDRPFGDPAAGQGADEKPQAADPASGTTPRPGPESGEPIDGWRRADGDWLAGLEAEDEEGYEPPPPDPLPRPTSKVVGGILLLIAGCIALFSPTVLPIPVTLSVALGVGLIGGGVGYLLMQLRDRPDDPFDDGARV